MPVEKKLYFNTSGARNKGSLNPADYSETPHLTTTVSLESALETVSICQCHFDAKVGVKAGLVTIANPELHALTTFTGCDADLIRIWADLNNSPKLEVITPAGAVRVRMRLKRLHSDSM